MANETVIYRRVNVYSGKPSRPYSPSGIKSLLGNRYSYARRDLLRGAERIERAVITEWEDVTEEFTRGQKH